MLLILTLAGCGILGDGPREELSLSFGFDQVTLQGWTPGLADYAADEAPATYDFVGEARALPNELDMASGGAFLASTNFTDDLFTYMKQPISGLVPGARYGVHFGIQAASNAPSGCAGIGGAPGESVYLKVGASSIEPKAVVEGDRYRMNVDIGSQSEAGADTHVLGDIANGAPCASDVSYRLITRQSTRPIEVEANAEGVIWVFVGTDSGFEGRTGLYYDLISLRFVGV